MLQKGSMGMCGECHVQHVGTPPIPSKNMLMTCPHCHLHITKGSVSYLSSPCFSTIIGGIGGPARAKRRILDVMC